MEIQQLAQAPFGFTSFIIILIGLAVGSFVNVVIYRVPREMSIVMPGSHCPSCHTPVQASDNIPLLSFIRLGGRCRSCGERISIRYPIVELITGALFWIVWRVDGLSWSLLPDWAFVSAMVALALIDLEHRLLPDRITYPGFVLALGFRGFVHSNPDSLWLSLTDGTAWLVGSALIAASGFVMLAIEWLDYYFVGRRIEEIEHALAAAEATELFMASQTTPGNDEPPHRRDACATFSEEPVNPPPETSSSTNEDASVESPSAHGHYLGMATIALGLLLAGVFLSATVNKPDAETLIAVKSMLGAWAGAALGAGTIWGLRTVYFVVREMEGVGFGDVKMMMMVGAYLSWPGAFLTLLLASLLGSIIGVIIMIRQRDRFVGIPYGLFIAIAAIIALLAGKPLVGWYWAQM